MSTIPKVETVYTCYFEDKVIDALFIALSSEGGYFEYRITWQAGHVETSEAHYSQAPEALAGAFSSIAAIPF